MSLSSHLGKVMSQFTLLAIMAFCLGFGINHMRSDGLHVFSTEENVPDSTEAVKIISIPEAMELHKSMTAMFVDVRDFYDYSEAHVPGALNLPLGEALDSSDPVKLVLYCSSTDCKMAGKMAEIMDKQGIEVVVMEEGMRGWFQSGGSLEVTE